MIGAAVTQLALVLVGVAGLAYLSACEIALISASRTRLRHRALSDESGARRALRLLERREMVLILFLIGQSALNALSAVLTTGLVDQWLGRTWVTPLVSTVGLSLVVLVLAEIVPKVVAQQRPESFLARQSRPLEVLHHLLLPLTAAVHVYIRALLRLVGHERRDPFVTREELRVLVRQTEGADEASRREQGMLAAIFDFRETVVREVMIPMNRVLAVETGTPCAAWRELVERHGHTRLPVYERQRDRVVGVINIFDLLFDAEPKPTVEAYMRPAPLVPDSKRIDHLLVELQKARNPIAVVVDEFGACRGIVTIEDIAEEIVGEMEDEHERVARKIRCAAPGVFIVAGLTDIDDFNQELGLALPKGRYDTVAGLVLKRAGRIPRTGERFTFYGINFDVLEADAYSVRMLKVTLPAH